MPLQQNLENDRYEIWWDEKVWKSNTVWKKYEKSMKKVWKYESMKSMKVWKYESMKVWKKNEKVILQ